MVLEFGKLVKFKALYPINVDITDKYISNKISGRSRKIKMRNHWDFLEEIFVLLNHVPIYFPVITIEYSSTILWHEFTTMISSLSYFSFFFRMAYSKVLKRPIFFWIFVTASGMWWSQLLSLKQKTVTPYIFRIYEQLLSSNTFQWPLPT